MERTEEFDSDFCNVKYVEEDRIVFLTWKKFCCLDNYRAPAAFALRLLKEHPGSNFIVDARNGFEDVKEDVEWGFTYLLPEMAKTQCEYVAFILNEVNEIEEEMDLWTKEFGKYFAVVKAESYIKVLKKMKESLCIHVTYTIKDGKRDEFLTKVHELGIDTKSRQESGNKKYEYFLPLEYDNKLFLLEIWTDKTSQEQHGKMEHFKMLQALKAEYVTDTKFEKYQMSYN